MIRYYVTNRLSGNVIAAAERAVRNGVEMIQVREKDLSARELLRLVCVIRDIAAGTSTRVLVNDRLDVALASGIEGVHLPGDGLPADRVRPFVKVVGASVHSVDQAQAAEKMGVNFVVYGPVFATPGKVPVGVDALRTVVEAVSIPVLAIGGITEANTEDVMRAGAAGFAAIRMFQSKT